MRLVTSRERRKKRWPLFFCGLRLAAEIFCHRRFLIRVTTLPPASPLDLSPPNDLTTSLPERATRDTPTPAGVAHRLSTLLPADLPFSASVALDLTRTSFVTRIPSFPEQHRVRPPFLWPPRRRGARASFKGTARSGLSLGRGKPWLVGRSRAGMKLRRVEGEVLEGISSRDRLEASTLPHKQDPHRDSTLPRRAKLTFSFAGLGCADLTAMPAPYYSTEPLDRSPSLSSNSSGASSAQSLPPVTPALPPASSFPSLNYKDVEELTGPSDYVPLNISGANLRNRPGSIGNLASFSRDKSPSVSKAQWSAGHKTGAGSASFDSARSAFGATGRSPSLRTNLLAQAGGRDSPTEDKVAAWRTTSATSPTSSPGSVARGPLPRLPPTSPVRASTPTEPRSSSPISFTGAPFPQAASPNRGPLPIQPSYTPAVGTSPGASARIRASSIFSTREAGLPPPSSSPLGTSPHPQGVAGPVRGQQEGGGSYARGHRRAMTLPQLGAAGLPLPPGQVDAEVAGKRTWVPSPRWAVADFPFSWIFRSPGTRSTLPTRRLALPLLAFRCFFVLPWSQQGRSRL